jgi:lipoate-protein ligase A
MAVDEILLNSFSGNDIPILRLYTWERSLSFGRFSDVKNIVDFNFIKDKKLNYVRRMSGGGVLVHGGDISYSLILPKNLLQDIGVKESYRYLCGFILNLYKKLGLDANFASELYLETQKSSICMMSNEAYDIVIDSKKIGGNAQRYTKNALFQHGSIPISVNKDIFEDVFLDESGLSNMYTLDKIDPYITTESLKKLILEAFRDVFEVEFIKSDLTPLQKSSVDELLKKKYASQRWNIDAKQD